VRSGIVRLGPICSVLLILAVGLLPGCLSSLSTTPDEELPLNPVTGSDRSTGRQQASIELTDRGRQLLESGQGEEASSVFQKAISLFPSNPYPYYYLAKTRYMQQEYPKALPLLGQAERFLGDDPIWLSRVYVLRGRTYEALSRFDEAKNQYRQALSKDPGNPEAREGIERIDHGGDEYKPQF
jgi:tetratricopeptide (TPR) repeat protein